MENGVPPDPPFTLTELRYALAVAETKHFGRAAKACHVSQPTLSAGIKRLEESIGCTLFERTSKRVGITEAGVGFLAGARRTFDEIANLTDFAGQQRAPLAGRFRIGIIPTVSPYMLPWLVGPLRRAHRELELVVQEDMTHITLGELRAHRLEFAILALPIDDTGLEVRPLFDETFFVLAPADHPIARQKVVEPSELASHRVLLLSEGHCFRDHALEVCRDIESGRVGSEGDFRATSLETIRQMVIAGMGITLLPAMALRADDRRRKSTRVIPFKRPVPSRRIALVWRRGFARAEGGEDLARFIRAHLPATVSVARTSAAVNDAA